MASLADKFSRLAALKPSRSGATSKGASSFARAATRRAPEQEDALSQLVGAAISTNHYGEHVSVSNWYSTPEFVEASSNTLDLLCRSRDTEHSKRTLAALSDPTKWLFLDTETTGFDEPEVIQLASPDQYRLMVEDFADAVQKKLLMTYDPADSVKNMRVIEALFRAAREGTAVRVE